MIDGNQEINRSKISRGYSSQSFCHMDEDSMSALNRDWNHLDMFGCFSLFLPSLTPYLVSTHSLLVFDSHSFSLFLYLVFTHAVFLSLPFPRYLFVNIFFSLSHFFCVCNHLVSFSPSVSLFCSLVLSYPHSHLLSLSSVLFSLSFLALFLLSLCLFVSLFHPLILSVFPPSHSTFSFFSISLFCAFPLYHFFPFSLSLFFVLLLPRLQACCL